MASNPRVFHKPTGEWCDGDPLFLRGRLWCEPAENIAESLAKGTWVIGTGRLQQRSYEDRHGGNRTVIELLVEEIGPSLRWVTAKIEKRTRSKTTAERLGGRGSVLITSLMAG